MATVHQLNIRTTHKERLLTEAIQERRATQHFEPTPIPEQDLHVILRAGLDAPSGYNLQPWRFVVVQDAEQRKKLRKAAMNQPKVEEAPVVIVACGDPEGWRKGDLDEMLRLAKQNGYGGDKEHEQLRQTVTGAWSSPPGSAMGVAPDWAVWTNRHVMIAFTTMMWTAEVLGYDTAPMEGFFEDQVKSTLGIPESIRVVALLAIGHGKGLDKPYGGRFDSSHICFGDRWGNGLQLEE